MKTYIKKKALIACSAPLHLIFPTIACNFAVSGVKLEFQCLLSTFMQLLSKCFSK